MRNKQQSSPGSIGDDLPPSTGAGRIGRPRGPATDPAVRRAELLEACASAIGRHGPSASMEDLAAEAGISRPILYRHFGDREGIARALVERFLARLTERMAEAIVDDQPIHRTIRNLVDAFMDTVDEERDVYRFVVRESTRAAATEEGSSELGMRLLGVEDIATTLAELLRPELESSGGDAELAEPAAVAGMGLVLATTEWWMSPGQPRPGLPRHEFVDLVFRLLWATLSEIGIGAETCAETKPPPKPKAVPKSGAKPKPGAKQKSGAKQESRRAR